MKKRPSYNILLICIGICQVVSNLSFVSGFGHKTPMEQVTHQNVMDRVNHAMRFLDTMRVHENNMRGQSMIDKGSPFHGVLISYRPENASIAKGRAGVVGTRSMQMMVAFHCSGLFDKNRDECTRKASKYTMMGTKMHEICSNLTEMCTKEEYSSIYRSITGHCNHPLAHKGESFTAYGRLLSPVYLDGIETLRRAVDKKPLPNARSVSEALTNSHEVLHNKFTMAVLQWGQFVEHDLSRPAISPMYHFDEYFQCCRSDGFNIAPRYFHKFCAPISLSSDAHYNNIYKHCMSYVRSLPALRSDCSFGPQEQLNQATHFLDGSQVYGSSAEKNFVLRASNGYYKTSEINNKQYLPRSENPVEDCLTQDNKSLCFTSGDPRVNFEPQIIAMYTLWAREHNRLVNKLKMLNNTHWSNDDLYEEARRIVIALIQHITYDEWLTNILAKKYQTEIDKYLSFRESVNPSVLNSVGITVLRSFKSLYPENIRMYSENRNEFNNITLKSVFYKPDMFKKPAFLDSVVRGIATQVSGKIDLSFNGDLINQLYSSDEFGYDILSLDIQRGRDHGLPPYNYYRRYLGFKYATTFNDLNDVMSEMNYHKLSEIYTNPSDIDLIIGGIMEKPVDDSLFGPTFSWLLTNQLIRTRQADRYFYTNIRQPKPFTKAQIEQINKITLARIICDNSDIKRIQPNVFHRISESNNLVSCDSKDIRSLDLRPWIEEKTSYTLA